MESVGLHSQARPAPTGPRPEWGPADPSRRRGRAARPSAPAVSATAPGAPRQRRLGALGLALCLAASVAVAEEPATVPGPAVAASSEPLLLESGPEGIRLRANDVPLSEILGALAARTGLEVEVEGPLDQRTSIEIDRVPLREALESLLADHGFVLRQGVPGAGGGATDPGRLWVYPRESVSPAPRKREPSRPCSDGPAASATGLPCLGRTLSKAPDPAARRRAISELARVGGERAASSLAAAAVSDADSAVRRAAVFALTEIDDDPAALGALEQALHDPEIRVRKAAVDALTDLGSEAAAWALAGALEDPDLFVRERSVHALGEIGGDTALLLVERALGDHHPRIRQAAAEVLDEQRGENPPR